MLILQTYFLTPAGQEDPGELNKKIRVYEDISSHQQRA